MEIVQWLLTRILPNLLLRENNFLQGYKFRNDFCIFKFEQLNLKQNEI